MRIVTDQNVELARLILDCEAEGARLEAFLADAATVADRRHAAVVEPPGQGSHAAGTAYFQISRLENRKLGHRPSRYLKRDLGIGVRLHDDDVAKQNVHGEIPFALR